MPLINISIIWLCSLLVYELFLKKETFHRLNRLYLLFTFIAGIVLPLLPWGYDIIISQETSRALHAVSPVAPSASMATEQKAIQATATTAAVSWYRLIYLAGAAASLLYLLYDTLRLALYYRKAATERSGKWIIAQTEKAHTPFSFGNIIFVGNREQYTEQQWQMVLQHEQQHHIQKHVLDLVLLQLASVVFWFHPLVYVYRHKLRLLHEYEADQEQEQDIQVYGHFLIEQAVLGSAPAMAPSFNYSPIKNRIHMLTKKRSKRSVQLRLLLLLPMLGCFVYCCALNKEVIPVAINNNKVSRKSSNIQFRQPEPPDTFYTEQGKQQLLIKRNVNKPEMLDNALIAAGSSLAVAPECLQSNGPITIDYIIQQAGLEPLFAQMQDGVYHFRLSHILIDPKGHIAYYVVSMPYLNSASKRDPQLTPTEQQLIHERLAATLINDDLSFTIEKDKTGAPIPYEYPDQGNNLTVFITVKDHQVAYGKDPIPRNIR